MSDSFHDEEPARLYRDAPRPEPPPALDAAILAAARRDALAGPRPALSFGSSPLLARWGIPLSVAAVVVVSASMVFLVEQERHGDAGLPGPVPVQGAAPPAPAAPAPAASLPAKGDAATGAAAPESAQPPPARAAARTVPEAAATGPAPAAVDAPRERGTTAASGMLESRATDQPRLMKQALPPTVAPTAPSATVEPAAAIAPLAGKAPPAAVAAPATSAAAEMKRRDAAADAGNQARAERAGAMRAEAQAVAASPDAWLARIEALRRDGKLEEAGRSLEEFRKRYPAHPIPAHLKSP